MVDSDTFGVAFNHMLEILVYAHLLPQTIAIYADQY
jgi:hypothetical protein